MDKNSTDSFKKKFLYRLLVYKLQYVVATFVTIIAICVYGAFTTTTFNDKNNHEALLLLFGMATVFNMTTYFYSLYMSKKYGINMFDDLDQNWLKEYQGFDAEAFGEIFGRLIQCRKIAGLYGFFTLTLFAVINTNLAIGVAVVYTIGYLFYRNIYFDKALADRIPRAFGGGSVVSRVIDRNSATTVK